MRETFKPDETSPDVCERCGFEHADHSEVMDHCPHKCLLCDRWSFECICNLGDED